MDLVTYLGFDGNCEAAFGHYEKVLGGRILMMLRMADAPAGEPVKPGFENRIMHARLAVGDRLLMGGDTPMDHFSKPQGFCAHIMVDGPAEAERIFRELGEGGTVTMPIAETFWARRFGMLIDRFGTPWMVNCEKEMGAPAEPSTKPFMISRTFDAPRDLLWKCFTDPDRMKQWWGPKGAAITASKMDLRPGGTYLYGMRTPDGTQMWGRMVYREIVAPERIEFINSFSDEHAGLARHPLAPTWPIELLSTFAFGEAERGKSTFTVTWTPHYPSEVERATFDAGHDSMRNGWTGTLDRLADHLAKAGKTG